MLSMHSGKRELKPVSMVDITYRPQDVVISRL